MGLFESIQWDIKAYCTALESTFTQKNVENERVKISLPMLQKIAEAPGWYDKTARLNIRWIGDDLKSIIHNKALDDEGVASLCRYMARIARENSLRSPYIAKSPEKELLEYFYYGHDFDNMEDKETADVIWGLMPKSVAAEHLEQISEKEGKIESEIKSWDDKIKGYKETIDSYVAELKNQQGKFNFVRLSKAFHEMHAAKKIELRNIFITMLVLGGLVISPLLYHFYSISAVESLGSANFAALDIWKLLSLAGVELALLYFFRIALKSYYSVKAQLLQLELRLSLCSFIENYADFAKLRKTKDVDPLAKFESIIFSGITPDDGNVPSTFDGVDQLLRLAKEFKAR